MRNSYGTITALPRTVPAARSTYASAESEMNLLAAKGSLLGMETSRQNSLAWRELGDIYSGLGFLEDAIDAYRQALQEAGVAASPLAFSDLKIAEKAVNRPQR